MQYAFIFEAVTEAYLESDGPLSNQDVYDCVRQKLGVSRAEAEAKTPVGEDGTEHNLFHRKVRWVQQTLKKGDILQRVGRGNWEIHRAKRQELKAIKAGKSVLAFSTDLGLCIWTQNPAIFKDVIEEDIHLMFSSPPYPICKGRLYGKVAIADYIDFICRAIEPIIPRLARGANIALNLSNDIFEPGLPSRSTYLERLIIALEDRMGLALMDRHIWMSNKPPGPVQYASIQRNQLNVGYEPIIVMCNDPKHTLANNRRVLEPHSERHQRFVEGGGVQRASYSGDGAHNQRVGAYSKPTEGRIPRNIRYVANHCAAGMAVNSFAKEQGLPVHGAKMPLAVADFFVRYLTRPGDLVVDLFSGTGTTAHAAQNRGRRFVVCEMMLEYIKQSFSRFADQPNSWFNPALSKL